MRVNVYGEEVTPEVVAVKKIRGDGKTFYGMRVFLQSPDALHHNAEDDDRSCVTFWVPWTKTDGHDLEMLDRVVDAMSEVVENIQKMIYSS